MFGSHIMGSAWAPMTGTTVQCGPSTLTVSTLNWALEIEYKSHFIYSAQSRFLVSGSADNMLKLWEVATGKCLYTWEFPHTRMPTHALLSSLPFHPFPKPVMYDYATHPSSSFAIPLISICTYLHGIGIYSLSPVNALHHHARIIKAFGQIPPPTLFSFELSAL